MYLAFGFFVKQLLYNFKIPTMLICTKISCYSAYMYIQNIEKESVITEYFFNYDY